MLLVSFGALPAQAQTAERCFIETGFCISGRIRLYWEQHGGLEIFGYPISNIAVVEDTGRMLRSEQYFERRRMELIRSEAVGHPSILLGLLGNELGTGAANWPIIIQTIDKRSTPYQLLG
jgi:hypothetical protein